MTWSSPLVLDGGLGTTITGLFVAADGFALRGVVLDFVRWDSWEDGSLSESQSSMYVRFLLAVEGPVVLEGFDDEEVRDLSLVLRRRFD